MSVVRITVQRWTAQIEPDKGPPSGFQYSVFDGRTLYANGTLAGPKPAICEVIFHPEKSAKAKAQDCDGFAEFLGGGDNTTGLRVHIDLSEALWRELWSKALLVGVKSTIWFTLLDGSNEPPLYTKLRLASPIISFMVENEIERLPKQSCK